MRADYRQRRGGLAIAVSLAWLVATKPAAAADAVPGKAPAASPSASRCAKVEPRPGTPSMPVGYVFGFTDPTDAGDPCTSELVVDNVTHAGKRDGRYLGSTAGAEISYTVMHDVAVAAGSTTPMRDGTILTVLQGALAAIGDGVAVNRLDTLDRRTVGRAVRRVLSARRASRWR